MSTELEQLHFLGVFVLALCDHAQNGFFHASEWWPVAASALAAGFLSVALVDRRGAFLIICFGVLALQAVVGLLGFYFHVAADVNGLSASLFENFVHGAPPFAPLLFVDLGILAAIGLGPASTCPPPGGYSGGSGTRNPEEVEHRFRRKWNSESGKWNTESGGSGTSIPEEVEQRFRRS